MKQIFLVRHAKSEWSNPNLGDFARPLNARGRKDAPAMAELMVTLQHKPDLIVSSTAVRALTTAESFFRAFNLRADQYKEEPRIYEANIHIILKIITELPADADVVYLFGHNYTFSEVAAHFSDEIVPEMPTCAIVHITAEVDSWREFMFPAAQYSCMWKPKDA